MFVKGMTHCLSDLEVVSLAEMAHGHVGGDLKAVCLEGRGGWVGGVRGLHYGPLSHREQIFPLQWFVFCVLVCRSGYVLRSL